MPGTVGARNAVTGTRVRNPGTPLDFDWVMGAHVNRIIRTPAGLGGDADRYLRGGRPVICPTRNQPQG